MFKDKVFLSSFFVIFIFIFLIYCLPFLPSNQISIVENDDQLTLKLKSANQIYLYESPHEKLKIYRTNLYNEDPLKWWNFIKEVDLKSEIIIIGNKNNNIVDARGVKTVFVKIFGGKGDDVLLGARLNDVIHGNGGNDLIVGCFGSDDLYGESGDDVIFGDEIDEGFAFRNEEKDEDYFGKCNIRSFYMRHFSDDWFSNIENDASVPVKLNNKVKPDNNSYKPYIKYDEMAKSATVFIAMDENEAKMLEKLEEIRKKSTINSSQK